MFVPISPPPPSPQAQELGEQLALFVAEYREDNPDVSSVDIERAFLLARDQLRHPTGSAPSNVKTAMLFAAGLALTGGLGVLLLFLKIGGGGGGGAGGGGGGGSGSGAVVLPIILAIGGLVLVLALIAVVVRCKR